MTISLMKYGRVFLFDPEGNSVAAYSSDKVDRNLIDYLKQRSPLDTFDLSSTATQ
jgi:hypothetical protein